MCTLSNSGKTPRIIWPNFASIELFGRRLTGFGDSLDLKSTTLLNFKNQAIFVHGLKRLLTVSFFPRCRLGVCTAMILMFQ